MVVRLVIVVRLLAPRLGLGLRLRLRLGLGLRLRLGLGLGDIDPDPIALDQVDLRRTVGQRDPDVVGFARYLRGAPGAAYTPSSLKVGPAGGSSLEIWLLGAQRTCSPIDSGGSVLDIPSDGGGGADANTGSMFVASGLRSGLSGPVPR